MEVTKEHQDYIENYRWLQQRIADAEQDLANAQRSFVDCESPIKVGDRIELRFHYPGSGVVINAKRFMVTQIETEISSGPWSGEEDYVQLVLHTVRLTKSGKPHKLVGGQVAKATDYQRMVYWHSEWTFGNHTQWYNDTAREDE